MNRSHNAQRPVEHQLLVALRRLGTEGNGSSIGRIARYFSISEGTVELYTNRVIKSLIDIQPQVTTWPDQFEKRDIARRIQEKFDFPNSVGFIDGSLIPFFDTPTLDARDWFCRKGRYGTNCLIVTTIDFKWFTFNFPSPCFPIS